MKILIALLWSFLVISSPTIEQDNFLQEVRTNYDIYYLLTEEETVIGDIVVVLGMVNNKLYVSGYIYNTTNEKHIFIVNQEEYQHCFYKVPLTSDTEIIVTTTENSFFKKYKINISADEYLKLPNLQIGEGQNDFPKEQNNFNIRDIFVILVFVTIGIITIFAVSLTILYRNKKGRFSQDYVTTDNYSEIIDIDIDTPEKTKEELMEEAYEDYRNGKISENELNARLRNIWWTDND